MATLNEVVSFLEQGAVLRSNRGESLRLIAPGKVEWVKAKGFLFDVETVTLAQVRAMSDVWDWSVVNGTIEQEGR